MSKMMLNFDDYIAKARSAVSEGQVLVKNDHKVLPLAEGAKVAVFGRIQTNYYKSGTGSGGMVNVNKVTGILDALLESGKVKINEKLMNTYEEWEREHPFDEGIGWGNEPWSQPEMELDDELVKEAADESEVAIIIIGRTAGEDQDNLNHPGSYLLTENEEKMIKPQKPNDITQKIFSILNQ